AARGRRARVGARPVGLLAARVLVGEDPGVGLRPDVRGPARRPAPRRGGAAAGPPPRAPPLRLRSHRPAPPRGGFGPAGAGRARGSAGGNGGRRRRARGRAALSGHGRRAPDVRGRGRRGCVVHVGVCHADVSCNRSAATSGGWFRAPRLRVSPARRRRCPPGGDGSNRVFAEIRIPRKVDPPSPMRGKVSTSPVVLSGVLWRTAAVGKVSTSAGAASAYSRSAHRAPGGRRSPIAPAARARRGAAPAAGPRRRWP